MKDLFFLRRKQKGVSIDPAVFACISMVALAIGPAMAKDIHDILESMFAVGLRFVNNCSTNVCAKYRILLAYKQEQGVICFMVFTYI